MPALRLWITVECRQARLRKRNLDNGQTPKHGYSGNDGAARNQLIAGRWELLRQIDESLDKPMIFLGLIWLVLIIIDLVTGLSGYLRIFSLLIWIIFIFDFALGLLIAPHRRQYLRKNWVTAASLLLPALRLLRLVPLLRVLRLSRITAGLRAGRSLRLLRLLTSVNRSMRSTRRFMARRRLGTVLALTMIVIFSGAAGMVQFENRQALIDAGIPVSEDGDKDGLNSYGESLWWTAMVIISIGSDYWPHTPEGRVLCWLIALYGFAVFGYITAALASVFIGLDSEQKDFEETAADS